MSQSSDAQTKTDVAGKVNELLVSSRKGIMVGVPVLALAIAVLIAIFAIRDRTESRAVLKVLELEESLEKALDDKGPDTATILAELENIIDDKLSWSSAKAALLLSAVHQKNGEWTKALETLESVPLKKAGYMAPIILFNAAASAEEAGDSEKALSLYIQCDTDYAESFPEAPRVVFSIARIQETLKNREAALGAYRRLVETWPEDAFSMLAQSRLVLLDDSSLK